MIYVYTIHPQGKEMLQGWLSMTLNPCESGKEEALLYAHLIVIVAFEPTSMTILSHRMKAVAKAS